MNNDQDKIVESAHRNHGVGILPVITGSGGRFRQSCRYERSFIFWKARLFRPVRLFCHGVVFELKHMLLTKDLIVANFSILLGEQEEAMKWHHGCFFYHLLFRSSWQIYPSIAQSSP
jgi:hypothetical protein